MQVGVADRHDQGWIAAAVLTVGGLCMPLCSKAPQTPIHVRDFYTLNFTRQDAAGLPGAGIRSDAG